MDDPTESIDVAISEVPPPRGAALLNGVLIGVHALGSVGYLAIGASVVGWETCDIPGADGGADFVAGLYLLPVLFLVLLTSLGCLLWAAYVYGKHRYWPFSRYTLAVPAFWALAFFFMRCPHSG
jgi:hypothetical protein